MYLPPIYDLSLVRGNEPLNGPHVFALGTRVRRTATVVLRHMRSSDTHN